MCKAVTVISFFVLLITLLNAVSEVEGKLKKEATKSVNTKLGDVQGKEITVNLEEATGKIEKKVQWFPNIPYAEPPIRELRLEKPVPKQPWKSPLKINEDHIACVQNTQMTTRMYKIQEDCLILNVWTPSPRPEGMTVMVWIHGGGFVYGSSHDYKGEPFVAVGDVILVTINYRLNMLGFLSTGDNRLQSNIGLFDQRLALKWVKENIQSFGGNPDSITIFGESAGAACVSAHTVSSGSWPYFDRAIMQSGSVLMPWAIATEEHRKHILEFYLTGVGCQDNKELLRCLRSVAISDIQEVTSKGGLWTEFTSPSVDGEFFTEHPNELMKKGKVKRQDIIIGTMKDEMYMNELFSLAKSRDINFYLNNFEKYAHKYFGSKPDGVYKKARELYIPKCIPSFLEAMKAGVDFETDRMMKCGSLQHAKLKAQIVDKVKKNVYYFQYSHASMLYNYMPMVYVFGMFGQFCGHGVDTVTTFGTPIGKPTFVTDDKTLSMRMILYWTNFAKHGDPNLGKKELPIVLDNIKDLPNWPEYSKNEEYLNMGSYSKMTIGMQLRKKYCEFLEDPEGAIKKEPASAVMITPRSDDCYSPAHPHVQHGPPPEICYCKH